MELADHSGKLILRQTENHRDRLQLRDHHKSAGIRGVNDVADSTSRNPNAPGDRRRDVRVRDLQLALSIDA